MGKRIRLGQLSGSAYGLKVSKEGHDVDSATGKNLLFDSTNAKTAIYFGKTINVGSNAVNHNIDSRSNFDSSKGYITHNGTKLQYNPLVVVIEDATGQNLDHAISSFSSSSGSGTYNSISGYISRLGVNSGTIFTETIKETGALYRTSAFYALSGTEGDSVTSTNNSYSFESPTVHNVKCTVRSYCFTANSGDHTGPNSLLNNPSNSENQRYNTFGNSNDIFKSDVTTNVSGSFGTHLGFNLRTEFRKQTGEALNDKNFRKDDGSFYTVPKANLGGLPITNAKVAVSTVPCGYGFMNSTFMGF